MQTPSLDVPESGAPEDTRTPLLAARQAEGEDVDRGSRRSLEPPDLIGVSPAHGEFRGVLVLEPYFVSSGEPFDEFADERDVDNVLTMNANEVRWIELRFQVIQRHTSAGIYREGTIMRKAPKDVDAYIAGAPKDARAQLVALRKVIKDTAPEAEERISYSMPYYHYHGRLVYFAAFKNHIGLYIPSPIIEEHEDELADYETSKGTVRFPIGKPLPVSLIKKVIKARIQKIENPGKRTKRPTS
jgi:uncharacterized protein YdhG (YjbR/CyaY superfamily)